MTYWANFLLECPDHAAARFLQRAPHADLHAALYEAARNFTAADAQDVWQCLASGQTIYLASGPGVFACEVINGKVKDSGHPMIFARARTWLNDTMLELEQLPLKPAPTPQSTVATMLLRIARVGPRQASMLLADASTMTSTPAVSAGNLSLELM